MNHARQHRRMSGSPAASLRCLSTVAILGLSFLAGCRAELDSIETIMQRRSAALARLPEEDKTWKRRVAPASPRDWPEALITPGVLTLEEARSIGLRFNPDIHAARARIDQALARIAEARSVYFPTITLGHIDRRTFQSPSTGGGFTVPFQQSIPTLPTNLQSLDISTVVQFLAAPLLGLNANDLSTVNTNSFSQHTTNLAATWTLFDGLSREA
ncbi:MAG: TolC family protein, partial [Phycisphaerae bacterium]